MDDQQAQQSTKESRREEKEEKKEKERREAGQKRIMRNIRNWGIAIVIISGIVYGFSVFIQNAAPKGDDFSRAIPLLPAAHIPVDSPLPEYTSNPPSSGPHYAQTAHSGFRTEVIPDQNVIHNLEHGDVWIAFHPRIAESAQNDLKQFGAAKVIITPREANDSDIALVAWGRIDTFDLEGGAVSEERIRDFIKRYLNKGPEQITGPTGGI